jgi:hypothetical protein
MDARSFAKGNCISTCGINPGYGQRQGLYNIEFAKTADWWLLREIALIQVLDPATSPRTESNS